MDFCAFARGLRPPRPPDSSPPPRVCCATDGGQLSEFQLITNMRQQQFDFRNGAYRYLRNSCVVSLTDSSQLLARSAKILCSDSEAKATNTDIRFKGLAIDAWRFLSFVSSSIIPPLLLAMLLLVI